MLTKNWKEARHIDRVVHEHHALHNKYAHKKYALCTSHITVCSREGNADGGCWKKNTQVHTNVHIQIRLKVHTHVDTNIKLSSSNANLQDIHHRRRLANTHK